MKQVKNRFEMFLLSLLSRKFVLTALGAYALYSLKQYSEMVVLILGYLGVEGGADLVERYRGRTLTASVIEKAVSHNSDNDDGDVDRSVLVTGNQPLFDEEKTDDKKE